MTRTKATHTPETTPEPVETPAGSTAEVGTPQAVEYDPGPRPGFVRVCNEQTGGIAEVPEALVDFHAPKGWVLAGADASEPDSTQELEPSPEDLAALAALTDEERAELADLAAPQLATSDPTNDDTSQED